MSEHLRIPLSGRNPIAIVGHDWQILAYASWHSGKIACQANELAWIRVRQHAPNGTLGSQAVVYGRRESGPGGMPIGYRDRTAGYLCSVADIPSRVRAVADELDMPELAQEVCDELPPEVLP